MTRGHGWPLTLTMRGTFTPYSLPAFTGAFDLTPLSLQPHDETVVGPGQFATQCVAFFKIGKDHVKLPEIL